VKTVTVDEFRAHVDQYLAEVVNGDVVVTQDGKPWAVLHSVAEGVDSSAFANSPEFWQMIRQRRQEQGIPWDEAQKLLDLD
jgi:prevent-host-death family protein